MTTPTTTNGVGLNAGDGLRVMNVVVVSRRQCRQHRSAERFAVALGTRRKGKHGRGKEKRKTARFNSHKFRLYHRAVKCVAIRILMAHFQA